MANKPHMNLVTVGHVDHGKSTFVGRLLWDTNNIPETEMRKLKELAKELKKETFEFAFVMDSLKEERERGVTIDVMHKRFDTNKYYFTIIDAPGHRDFVKNMITGASQADAAILVVSAKEGIQDQTKEHAFLLKVLGVKQIHIFINKMDTVEYKEQRYNEVKADLEKLLGPIGYDIANTMFVPGSAYKGDMVAKREDQEGKDNMPWYKGKTMVQLLDELVLPEQPVDKPLRLPIQDVYTITGIGTVPVGRIETGVLRTGTKVAIEPAGVQAEIKTIEMHHEQVSEANPSDNVGFSVKGVSKNDIRKGDVIGSLDSPPTVAKEFTAQIIVLQHPNVITKGYTPVFHCHTAQVACKITEIQKKIDPRSGEVLQENPDFIKAGDAAIVKIVPTKPMVIESSKKFPELSRFAIRDMGMTVAAGICLDVTPVVKG